MFELPKLPNFLKYFHSHLILIIWRKNTKTPSDQMTNIKTWYTDFKLPKTPNDQIKRTFGSNSNICFNAKSDLNYQMTKGILF